MDIIGCTQWNRCITVNINDGNGQFDTIPPIQYSTIGHARSLVASDFNNDGFDDIAIKMDVHVKLEIFNSLGQKVAILVDERKTAGYYSMQWDATGQASGVYFILLKTDECTKVRKMLLMR